MILIKYLKVLTCPCSQRYIQAAGTQYTGKAFDTGQGSYELRRQLEYKQLWRGCQRCAYCSHIAKADVNGARNILSAGHAKLASGGMVQSGCPLAVPNEMIQATA